MSKPLDVLFTQRLFSSAGLYTGKLDGVWGPKSEAASIAFDAEFEEIKKTIGTFDPRTEANIHSLLPKAQFKARQFMRGAASLTQFTVKILSGTRTAAEQDRLYAQGRDSPGDIVTNARAYQSNHNFGLAWDCGIFQGGHYFTGATRAEEQAYIDLAKFEKELLNRDDRGPFDKSINVEWGGDWHNPDRPHYQLRTGKSVTELRALFEAGTAYV